MTSTELRPYKKTRDSEAVRPMMRDEAMGQGGLGCSGSSLLGGDEDGNEGVIDMVGIIM